MNVVFALLAAVVLLSLSGCAFAPTDELSSPGHPASPQSAAASMPQPRSLRASDVPHQHDHSQHDHSQHQHGGGR